WVLPVDAPQAATPWSKRFAVSAASAQQGAVAITVNGSRIEAASVASGANAEAVAAAIVARINSELWLPVEAEVLNDGEFSVRAVVPGSGGNAISIAITSEAAGVTINEGAVTQGAQTAIIKPLFKGLGSTRYHYIVSDFDDQANIAALADELTDRFSAMRQIGGRAFIAVSGSAEDALARA
ncbi:MAG: hypothetical protein FWC65_04250, partial [Treponema sp.]|nr:hypothetical protein [Treponema sp.]